MARFCSSCGTSLSDGQAFCGSCGAPVSGTAGSHVAAVPPASPAAGGSPFDDGGERTPGLVAGLIRWIAGLPFPISAATLRPLAEYVERKREVESRYPVRLHPLVAGVVAILGADVGRWLIAAFVAPIFYRLFSFVVRDAALMYLVGDLLNAIALIAGARVAVNYWQAAQPYQPLRGPSAYANTAAGWTPEKTRRLELGATIVVAVAIALYVFGLTQRYIHGFFGALLFTMFRGRGNDAGGVAGFLITAIVVTVCLRVLTPAIEAIVQES